MIKIIVSICALSFATLAVAQQGTAPTPPTGPTAAECQKGWQQGSKWAKEQFEAACLKIKEGQKN
jgi:hypothetical protein